MIMRIEGFIKDVPTFFVQADEKHEFEAKELKEAIGELLKKSPTVPTVIWYHGGNGGDSHAKMVNNNPEIYRWLIRIGVCDGDIFMEDDHLRECLTVTRENYDVLNKMYWDLHDFINHDKGLSWSKEQFLKSSVPTNLSYKKTVNVENVPITEMDLYLAVTDLLDRPFVNDGKQQWIPECFIRGSKESFDALIKKGYCEEKLFGNVPHYAAKEFHKGTLLTMKETILEEIENEKKLLEGYERE